MIIVILALWAVTSYGQSQVGCGPRDFAIDRFACHAEARNVSAGIGFGRPITVQDYGPLRPLVSDPLRPERGRLVLRFGDLPGMPLWPTESDIAERVWTIEADL